MYSFVKLGKFKRERITRGKISNVTSIIQDGDAKFAPTQAELSSYSSPWSWNTSQLKGIGDKDIYFNIGTTQIVMNVFDFLLMLDKLRYIENDFMRSLDRNDSHRVNLREEYLSYVAESFIPAETDLANAVPF